MEAYEKLEHKLQDLFGIDNIVVCSSGSTALYLASLVISKQTGMSDASFPNYCMPAVWMMAKQVGLTLHPLNVNTVGLTDYRIVNRYLPKCIDYCVHTYGRYASAGHFGQRYVIEDMAEAPFLPLRINSTAFCWSFYKNKLLPGQEGGAIGFWSKDLADLARRYRSLGLDNSYNVLEGGINARMSNANAHIILENIKTERYKTNQALAVEAMEVYQELLPKEWTKVTDSVERVCPWVYDFDLPHSTGRNRILEVVMVCNERSVEARPSFLSYTTATKQPFYYDNSRKIESKRMYLPLYVSIEEAKRNAAIVIQAVADYLG